jgi:hypothetical protein
MSPLRVGPRTCTFIRIYRVTCGDGSPTLRTATHRFATCHGFSADSERADPRALEEYSGADPQATAWIAYTRVRRARWCECLALHSRGRHGNHHHKPEDAKEESEREARTETPAPVVPDDARYDGEDQPDNDKENEHPAPLVRIAVIAEP